jgi:hypothetical protein
MLYSWLHSHLLSVPHNALFKPIFVCPQLFARNLPLFVANVKSYTTYTEMFPAFPTRKC